MVCSSRNRSKFFNLENKGLPPSGMGVFVPAPDGA